MFWFFIPIICLVLIVTNIWELEKLLIKLSYYVGLLGLNVGPIATFLSVLSAVFLAYVIIVAMIKRCHDLSRSGWCILSMLVPTAVPWSGRVRLYLAPLLFWPGEVRPDEPGIKNLTRIDLPSLGAAISVLCLFIIGLLVFFQESSHYKSAPFRVWNQTDQLLNVQVIASDGVVHQGYPADEVAPGGIIRNENILLGRDDYTVKAKNTRGDVVYSRDFTSEELAEIDWIVVIPPTPLILSLSKVSS